MKLIILIPALNEAESIAKTIKSIPQKITGVDEIVSLVINDGSADATAEIAKKNGAQVFSHIKNKGVGAAFHSGIEWALENHADMLVSIDADGQFDPKDIEKIIAPILENQADMVVGNRFAKGKPENMSGLKYWGNKKMNRLVSSLAGEKFEDVSSGFRAYNQKALLNINLLGKFTYTQEVFLDLSMKGLNIVQIPVDVKYFKERKSRVAGNIVKYAFRTSWIIFRTIRDYKPLKFFGLLGLGIFVFGLFFDGFLLGHYILAAKFSPYISIGFIGAYLNSIGLGIMFLGLIADMFDRVRQNQEKILYYLKAGSYRE
ncbi:glycosyltransferase family 2 protein [Candidatus Dojkabacteria bacterium]|nr:glycosyltransferase family 2 protein [Candidatus Dojkabacteria bacterium]